LSPKIFVLVIALVLGQTAPSFAMTVMDSIRNIQYQKEDVPIINVKVIIDLLATTITL